MTTFNFTDRISYLNWRAEWKANYKKLSEESRKAKIERSSANSAWAKLHRAWHEEEAISLWSSFHSVANQVSIIKRKANEQLEELKEAKVAAAESYQENKARECGSCHQTIDNHAHYCMNA
jgi:hypothetical protein